MSHTTSVLCVPEWEILIYLVQLLYFTEDKYEAQKGQMIHARSLYYWGK